MKNLKNEDFACLSEIANHLREGLSEITTDMNWLTWYEQWRNDDCHQFDGLLSISDSFKIHVAGDAMPLNQTDENCVLFFETISLSAFLSEALQVYTHKIVERVCKERNSERKVSEIDEYFAFIERCRDSHELAPAVVILNGCAEQQEILYAKSSIDLHISYWTLLELYQSYSVAAIYLRFTRWRISQERRDLKKLVDAFVQYIRAYFYDYDNNPDMHLNYPLDGLITIKKLAIIQHWIELITFRTEGIISEYKKRGWLLPVDLLVDRYILVNRISKYEMLQYKLVFCEDDDNTVRQKAICNHGYGVWIKTTDVVFIICDVARILYENANENVNRFHTSKSALLELYDNLLKLRDHYTGLLFSHRAYYQSKRKDYDSKIHSAQEEDAMWVGKSIDDVIQLTAGILDDDIDGLLQAKQSYIKRLSIYITEDQEHMLDEYIERVAQKIKGQVSKLSVYDTIYAATTEEFQAYALQLIKFPDIFSSLVSAEYLYQQYVEGKQPNLKFDYSCISIMYYMALEDFVNKLIYTPYAKEVLDVKSDEVYKDYKIYISSKSNFYDKKNKCYKKSCEIGILGYLLDALRTETVLQEFLQLKYGEINIDSLATYGIRLKSIAPRRNEAAHGGNLLTYEHVCTDKNEVYNRKNELYRGLILELLGILFKV